MSRCAHSQLGGSFSSSPSEEGGEKKRGPVHASCSRSGLRIQRRLLVHDDTQAFLWQSATCVVMLCRDNHLDFSTRVQLDPCVQCCWGWVRWARKGTLLTTGQCIRTPRSASRTPRRCRRHLRTRHTAQHRLIILVNIETENETQVGTLSLDLFHRAGQH